MRANDKLDPRPTAPIRPSTYTDDYWLWATVPNRQPSLASGKWLVFVPLSDVDQWWNRIRHAVEADQLGPVAKVATAKPSSLSSNPRARLICVYTADWRNEDDVRRVLRRLREMGVSWRLSYKTDEATVTGRYGSGASIYVSQPGSDDFDDRR